MILVRQPCDTVMPVTSCGCGSHLVHAWPSHGSGLAGVWLNWDWHMVQLWLACDFGMAEMRLRRGSHVFQAWLFMTQVRQPRDTGVM